MPEHIRVQLLRPGAKLPFRATELASGFDIYACLEDGQVTVGQRPVVVPTGIAMEVPWGLDAQFRPRSGLARQGVLSTFGTLDADYRGEVMITLYTVSPDITHTVHHAAGGGRIRDGAGPLRNRARRGRPWQHGAIGNRKNAEARRARSFNGGFAPGLPQKPLRSLRSLRLRVPPPFAGT
jgi:deoxyuridine 5'-triphosphate nucleotidohydrolase